MALQFKVTRREPVLISPATTTPHEYKPLSDIDDQQALRHHSAPALAFFRYNRLMDGKDPVQVIRQAIAKTLVFYYPFAGRLREVEQHGVIMNKMIVDCTGEGVMFIEADADISLDAFGDDGIRPPFRCLDQLLFDAPGSLDLLHSPLMLIQVSIDPLHQTLFRLRLSDEKLLDVTDISRINLMGYMVFNENQLFVERVNIRGTKWFKCRYINNMHREYRKFIIK